MPSPATDALNLIREIEHLLEQETEILASPEDADYFRKIYTRPAQSAKIPQMKNVPPKTFPPLTVPVSVPLHPKKDAFLGTPESVPDSPLPTPNLSTPRTETPSLPPPLQSSSLKTLLAKIAPELPLLEEIPSDAIAKKIATRWKTKNQTAPISILSLSEPPQQKALLENIAKALDVYFGPAKIVSAEAIEKEKQWEAFLSVPELKLIIACDYTLWQLASLLPFYRENTSHGTRSLGKISLFLLPDLSLYLKDPLLKRSLWKALCQKLST